MEKIDFVVTWVDGSDPKWQEKKNEVLVEQGKAPIAINIDSRNIRYRDLDCLKYWFRAVDKFAPWVNKVYFVTSGQKPDWLNTNYQKLVCINHSQYMPRDVLPTFNSNAIEACMHKIPGLSEQFVYFNDDMYLINPVKQEDFFKGGLPCDTMSFHPIEPKNDDKKFYIKLCNDIEIINKHFNFNEFKKREFWNCVSFKQGKHILVTIALMSLCSFRGFYTYHLPQAYLKQTFDKVWKEEPEILNKTMSYRFRENEHSVNHWLFQYWQFAEGCYMQRNSNFGTYINIGEPGISKLLFSKKYKTLCINDSANVTDFELAKQTLIDLFEIKYPDKSPFEL